MDEEGIKIDNDNEVEGVSEISPKITKASLKWRKVNKKCRRKIAVRKSLRLQERYNPMEVVFISDDDSKGIEEKISLGSKANFFFLPDYELENLNSRSLAKSISKEMMSTKWWFSLEKSHPTRKMKLRKSVMLEQLARKRESERRKLPSVLASKEGFSRRRRRAKLREISRNKSRMNRKNLKRKLSRMSINSSTNFSDLEVINEKRDYDEDLTELEAVALVQLSSLKKSKN